MSASTDSEAVVRLLRKSVSPQRDGSHLPLLFSLRQLRDASLRPFFSHLLEHEDWQIQTHAVLGLAEISETGNIDPWLVARANPYAQEAIVVTAIDTDLIDEPIRRQLATQSDFSPMARLMLIGEMVQRQDGDKPALPETEYRILLSLKDHEVWRVQSMSRLFLAQCGDLETFASWRDSEKVLPVVRAQREQWLLEAIREYRLTALSPWIVSRLTENEWPEETQQFAIITLLEIDREQGTAAWHEYLGELPTYARRMQAMMMLLATTPDLPIDLLDDVAGDERLLVHTVNAARAFAGGSNPVGEMIGLLEIGHHRTMEWVVSAASHLPDEHREQIYRRVLELLEDPPAGRSTLDSLAVRAVAELVKLNPELIHRRLLETVRGSRVREVMLLGLFETDDSFAGSMAADLPRVGFGRADSMALLLVAKHTDALSAEQVQQLGVVASGGGQLSDVLRVQAAWLHLKHSRRIESTLARVFAD